MYFFSILKHCITYRLHILSHLFPIVFSPLNFFQTVCNIFLLIFIFHSAYLKMTPQTSKSVADFYYKMYIQGTFHREFNIQLLKLEFKELNF